MILVVFSFFLFAVKGTCVKMPKTKQVNLSKQKSSPKVLKVSVCNLCMHTFCVFQARKGVEYRWS